MSRRYWYFYVSGDETNANNYTVLPPNALSSCDGGQVICAIYATASSPDPNLPSAAELNGTVFQQYIAAAKLSSSRYPIAPQQPYVYTKA